MDEHLTAEQHAQLVAELAELTGVKSIAAARAHRDLSENFEYHAAKNEQGLLERRISILQARLDSARIVEAGGSEVVAVGSRVVVHDDSGAAMEFELSSLGGAGTVSPSSPLGAALLGRRVGDIVEVKAPRGAWTATVIAIS